MPPLQGTEPQYSLSAAPPMHDDADVGEFDVERNKLRNKQLSERVERDIQRRRHRKIIAGSIAVICLLFYISFFVIVLRCFDHPELIEKIKTVWLVPLMAFVTVPTILLIVLIFCVYRQRPVLPPEIVRLLQRIPPEQ